MLHRSRTCHRVCGISCFLQESRANSSLFYFKFDSILLLAVLATSQSLRIYPSSLFSHLASTFILLVSFSKVNIQAVHWTNFFIPDKTTLPVSPFLSFLPQFRMLLEQNFWIYLHNVLFRRQKSPFMVRSLNYYIILQISFLRGPYYMDTKFHRYMSKRTNSKQVTLRLKKNIRNILLYTWVDRTQLS